MADNKVLDADYIKSLLAGDKKKSPTKPQETKVHFALTYKPDPLHLPQPGYEQKGDKGDIWAAWVKQGRTGAEELIERWG